MAPTADPKLVAPTVLAETVISLPYELVIFTSISVLLASTYVGIMYCPVVNEVVVAIGARNIRYAGKRDAM